MKTNAFRLILSSVLLLSISQLLYAELPVKKFATKDGSRPSGLFAPGVMIGKTLYISGKGDYRPGKPYEEKVRNCLNEVRKVLLVAGMDMENVVTSFCYLEEPERYAEFNKVYAEFFPNDPPARTTLGVPTVPGDSRIEITCIAYSDLSEKKRIGTPPEGFPFSPGILAGNTLYISGKGDHLPGGGHPATFEEQVRQAMKNVGAVLKDAGLARLQHEGVALERPRDRALTVAHEVEPGQDVAAVGGGPVALSSAHTNSAPSALVASTPDSWKQIT